MFCQWKVQELKTLSNKSPECTFENWASYLNILSNKSVLRDIWNCFLIVNVQDLHLHWSGQRQHYMLNQIPFFLAMSRARASQITLWRSGFNLNISWLFFFVLSCHWCVLEEGVWECVADGRGLHCTMLMMSLCDRQRCRPKTAAAEGFNVTGSCSNPSFVPFKGPSQTSQMEPERASEND